MKLSFTKMQGCANDYIYLDCRKSGVPENIAALSEKLSRRHFSIGADGIICICTAQTAGADRRVFVSGGGCLADDDIVGSILPAGKTAFAGERDQIVADRFCVVRAVRDGAQAFKPGKYLARLKIG